MTPSVDDARLAEIGAELAEGILGALPAWARRHGDRISAAWFGVTRPDIGDAAEAAGRLAATELGPRLRSLLTADSDAQTETPLALVRGAIAPVTAVLSDAGIPPVERDDFDTGRFPEDLYGLTPASFADISPDIHELGITWGAAKAYVHIRRRGD